MDKKNLILLPFVLTIPACSLLFADINSLNISMLLSKSVGLIFILLMAYPIKRIFSEDILFPCLLFIIGFEIELMNNMLVLDRLLSHLSSILEGIFYIWGLSVLIINCSKYIKELNKASNEKMNKKQLITTIVNTVPNAIAEIDLSGKIIFVNDTYCKISGSDKNKLINSFFWDSLPFEKDTRKFKKLFHELIQKHAEPAVIYGQISGTNNINIDIQWDWNYKRNLQGNIVSLVAVLTDISKLRKAENIIRNNEQEKDTILNSLSEFIVYQDLAYKVLWCNKSAASSIGLEPEETLNQYCWKLWCSRNSPCENCVINDVITKGQAVEIELIRPDGAIWLNKVYPLIDNNKEVYAIIKVAQDITVAKMAQKALELSQKKYQDLFTKSPVGLVKCNVENTVTDANNYCANILGASSPDEVKNRNLLDIHNAESLNIKEDLERVFNKHESIIKEIPLISHWNKAMWLHITIDPVVNQDNIVIEAIIAFEDITKRKKSEEEIRYLGYHDSLTGLYNRTFLNEKIYRLDVARQLPLSIIVGDLNGLKIVNDAFGHQEGDTLLVQTAHILKKACRTEDIIARMGGDEFIILLPQTDEKTSQEICNRIKNYCLKAEPDPIKPNIALGTASKTDPKQNINVVLSEADENMYHNKLLESNNTCENIIDSLKIILGKKIPEDQEHTARLQKICFKFGQSLGLNNNQLDRLSLLCQIHEIGNVNIPNEILNKKELLNSEEWDIIKKHPETAYRIAQSSNELAPVAEEVLAHHERWDGKGYPKGLKKDEIPFLSRIIAITEAYDVMTHDRPYKKAIGSLEAREEIKRCSSSHFDPHLAEKFYQFLDVYDKGESG